MKKKIFFLVTLIVAAICSYAQEPQELQVYDNAYIWAQGNRNTATRGSAFSTVCGRTFCMEDVIRRSSPNAVDFLLFYGRPKPEFEAGFYLFAPDDPVIDIDADDESETSDFHHLFTGSQRNPQGAAHIKNWDVRNATKIHKVEDVDFDNATSESIAAIEVKNRYLAGDLKEGDVVVFQTAETSANPSKKGLIKIGHREDDDRLDNAILMHFSKLNIYIKMEK
ncbi:MAG: hypothetical protein LBP96_03405 [Bacteroidales bacterium]|jgi:hypothetical protein|nr:hypothetical protein [Bacteroidales bacterium]